MHMAFGSDGSCFAPTLAAARRAGDTLPLMTRRAQSCLLALLAAACGSQSAQQRVTSPGPEREGPCARVTDPRAQAHAAALAGAGNILEYEAAWKRAYPAAALGGIGAAEVKSVVRAHTDELRRCYEKALAGVDSASGRVVVRFVIEPAGTVPAAHVAQDELGVPGVGCCLVEHVVGWKFPPPREGGYAVIEYPFTVRLSH